MVKQFRNQLLDEYTRQQIQYAKELVSEELNMGTNHPDYYVALSAMLQLIATNELARATRVRG